MTGLPASGLLKSTSVRPRSDDRILTSCPSRFSCMPRWGSIFCSWKCFVGIIRTSCGFRFPKASSGFRFKVYFLLASFPSMSLSKPAGSILCPTDRMNGLISFMSNFAFSASALIFVSKISSVFVIFPVNSISMKSFLFIIKNLGEEGF